MPEIGAWVLGAACRQMRDWRVLAWQPFRLAVNVSASQVGPDFDGWVKGVLADAELPAEYLEIELTETVMLDNVERDDGKLEGHIRLMAPTTLGIQRLHKHCFYGALRQFRPTSTLCIQRITSKQTGLRQRQNAGISFAA